jgi:ATP-binding cassette subfamily C (CFTR/MRP) protein 1
MIYISYVWVFYSNQTIFSLDQQSEAIVSRILENRFKDHTVISIAHKLDFVTDFDRVVVMDQGQVIESGKPDELLSRPSVFKELYQTQARRSDLSEGNE